MSDLVPETERRKIKAIGERVTSRDTRAFVARDTVDPLADKLVGIIGDRRMTKMHRYLDYEHGGSPRLFTGLRPDHCAYGGAVRRRSGVWVGVYLSGQAHRIEGISFGVGVHDETEEQIAHRYHHPEEQWLGLRRDITLVQLSGWPGEIGREDRIRIEYWNEHGVGQETIVVFDDMDPVQEIAWDVKGDRERRGHLWDEFCDHHGLHFEHPDHDRYGECTPRQSTRAEDLAVLALLAELRST